MRTRTTIIAAATAAASAIGLGMVLLTGTAAESPTAGVTPPLGADESPATTDPNPLASREADGRSAPSDADDELELAEVATVRNAERTEQGARDAAVAILELTEEAVQMTPADAADFQRPFSTVGFADEAAATTEEQMVELRRTIPDGVTLRLAPIAVRSQPSGDDWIVSIWFVEAITIGTEAVVDDWRTATYTMRWEDHAWKVAAFESVRGPMPGRGTQPASAPPPQFEALLTGFTDVGLN